MDQLTFGFEYKAIAKDLLDLLQRIEATLESGDDDEESDYQYLVDSTLWLFAKNAKLLADAELSLREKQ